MLPVKHREAHVSVTARGANFSLAGWAVALHVVHVNRTAVHVSNSITHNMFT